MKDGIGSGGMELNFNILLPKASGGPKGSVSDPPLLWRCGFISAVLLYVLRQPKSFDDFPDRPGAAGFFSPHSQTKKQVECRAMGGGFVMDGRMQPDSRLKRKRNECKCRRYLRARARQ